MMVLQDLAKRLSQNPIFFNYCRRAIEFNYSSLKKVVKEELLLDQEIGPCRSISGGIEKILDLPCGTGEFCTLFHPSNYIGLDISQTYIDYARRKYKYNFVCRDAQHAGFESSAFDKILVLGFFHHLDDSGMKNVIKEIKRILRKNGKLLVIEDAPTSSRWNFIGRNLQKYDQGAYIRSTSVYQEIFKHSFIIDKSYHIQSGFWDYSIFVLFNQ